MTLAAIAGIVMSPQLRESPETANFQVPLAEFCACAQTLAITSQTTRTAPARRERCTDAGCFIDIGSSKSTMIANQCHRSNRSADVSQLCLLLQQQIDKLLTLHRSPEAFVNLSRRSLALLVV